MHCKRCHMIHKLVQGAWIVASGNFVFYYSLLGKKTIKVDQKDARTSHENYSAGALSESQ